MPTLLLLLHYCSTLLLLCASAAALKCCSQEMSPSTATSIHCPSSWSGSGMTGALPAACRGPSSPVVHPLSATGCCTCCCCRCCCCCSNCWPAAETGCAKGRLAAPGLRGRWGDAGFSRWILPFVYRSRISAVKGRREMDKAQRDAQTSSTTAGLPGTRHPNSPPSRLKKLSRRINASSKAPTLR